MVSFSLQILVTSLLALPRSNLNPAFLHHLPRGSQPLEMRVQRDSISARPGRNGAVHRWSARRPAIKRVTSRAFSVGPESPLTGFDTRASTSLAGTSPCAHASINTLIAVYFWTHPKQISRSDMLFNSLRRYPAGSMVNR
ncbi:hypothetical protein BDZ97DRAFT_1440990 [Flammula alnicola]|nr:hypothetical protein BDZ97DRAFT_1440990 [Flammula alnicola]